MLFIIPTLMLLKIGQIGPKCLNRKSTNTPLLWLIFPCTLTLNEFLEAQLRSSKGVFVLILLNILGQICLLHVVKLKVT